VVSEAASADALVLVEGNNMLDVPLHDGIRWVQSSSAGNERLIRAGLVDDTRVWTSAAGVYARPIAEHALGLLLMAARNLHAYARSRSWQKLDPHMLGESTVGVVGAGGIGRALVAHLDALGARTIAITRSGRAVVRATRSGGPQLLPELLEASDYVVLSAPLTPETRRLVDARALERMQPHAWLVNVARGALVDTDALVAALREGRIAGAALDTVDPEPLPERHPLRGRDDVILTPHVAWYSEESMRGLQAGAPSEVRRVLSGEWPVHVVNPAVQGKSRAGV
jgi:D-3-phosphoglycerate dehydrogenase